MDLLALMPWVLLILDVVLVDSIERVQDLKLAIVVYRHGDRSAIYSYPTDPYGEGIWPDGFGQLTQKGVRQQYKLGKFLRKRYEHFFGPNISSNEVHIQSSGLARTLKSAAANAAGMFPPTSQQTWETDELGKMWQPMAIYSRHNEHDAVFSVSFCKQWRFLKHNLDDLPETAVLREKYESLTKLVKEQTNLELFYFPRTFYSVNDIFYTQSQHGYPLPSWATKDVVKQIKFLADLIFHMSAGGNVHKNPTQSNLQRVRLRGGNMLRVIMEKLKQRVQRSEVDEDVKLFVFSAHDENIAALLSALHLYSYNVEGENMGVPNYASCLFFELFRNNTVRISFKNEKPDTAPHNPIPMIHPNCVTFCALEDLVKLTRPYFMTEEEWPASCNPMENVTSMHSLPDDDGFDYRTKLGVGIAMLITITAGIVLILVCLVRSSRKAKKRQQQKLKDHALETHAFLNENTCGGNNQNVPTPVRV